MLAFPFLAILGLAAGVASYKLCVGPFAAAIAAEEQVERARAARAARESGPSTGLLARAGWRLERILPLTRTRERGLRERLDRAGVRMSAASWHGITVGATLSSLAAGLLAAATFGAGFAGAVTLAAAFAAAGYLSCRLYLSAKERKRRELIEKTLPDALERLSTVVTSGISVDEAFREIARGGDMGAVGEEFARVDREINLMDMTREEALTSMARRCQSVDMTFFASSLIQATRDGTSIGAALEQQSANARAAWFDRLRERIRKINTSISLPLGLCFLPATVILLVAPMLVREFEQLGQML